MHFFTTSDNTWGSISLPELKHYLSRTSSLPVQQTKSLQTHMNIHIRLETFGPILQFRNMALCGSSIHSMRVLFYWRIHLTLCVFFNKHADQIKEASYTPCTECNIAQKGVQSASLASHLHQYDGLGTVDSRIFIKISQTVGLFNTHNLLCYMPVRHGNIVS